MRTTLKSEAAKQALDHMLENVDLTQVGMESNIDGLPNVLDRTAARLTAAEAYQRMIALAYETAWNIESKAMMDRATIALATGSE